MIISHRQKNRRRPKRHTYEQKKDCTDEHDLNIRLSLFKVLSKIAKSDYWLLHTCRSVCPSVYTQGITCHPLVEFSLNLIGVFLKSVEKIQLLLKSDKTNEYLPEGQNTFLITPYSFLLRMRNILDKNCRENQNLHFMLNNYFVLRNSCCL